MNIIYNIFLLNCGNFSHLLIYYKPFKRKMKLFFSKKIKEFEVK